MELFIDSPHHIGVNRPLFDSIQMLKGDQFSRLHFFRMPVGMAAESQPDTIKDWQYTNLVQSGMLGIPITFDCRGISMRTYCNHYRFAETAQILKDSYRLKLEINEKTVAEAAISDENFIGKSYWASTDDIINAFVPITCGLVEIQTPISLDIESTDVIKVFLEGDEGIDIKKKLMIRVFLNGYRYYPKSTEEK